MTALINTLANSVLLFFIAGIPLYAMVKKINVFDAFIDGAKQGFDTCVKLIAYLVAMYLAIGMLRASGFFELLSHLIAPMLTKLGFPSELLPLALLRPFSGSASLAILGDLAQQHGGDSMISKMGATILGSTETTFYVIAIYFGSIGIKRTRHAIPAGLLADIAGIAASVYFCSLLFGSN